MKLISKETGKEIKLGDTVNDFRGDQLVVTTIYPPGTSQGGKNGRVGTDNNRIFYASVINAVFVE